LSLVLRSDIALGGCDSSDKYFAVWGNLRNRGDKTSSWGRECHCHFLDELASRICVYTRECFSNYGYVLHVLCIHRTRAASSNSRRVSSCFRFGETGFRPASDSATAGDGKTFGRELDSTPEAMVGLLGTIVAALIGLFGVLVQVFLGNQ
jgi:hypothetical protein